MASYTTGTITFPWHTTASTTTSYTTLDWPWAATASYTTIDTITYLTPPQQVVWQQAVWQVWDEWHRPVMLSAEEQQRCDDEAQARREEASRRRLAEQTRLEGAQERALELLELILSPAEKVYRAAHDDELLVKGSQGGLYVIEPTGVHGNVRKIDRHGCVLARLCAAPGMRDHDAGLALPLADGWIGQYLALKHDEAGYLAKANLSYQRGCERPAAVVPIAA